MTRDLLTIDAIVHRQAEVLSTQTPDETLALDIVSGSCFAFDGPSARIWALIETPIEVRQLVRQLVEEYDIEESDCREQTMAYLKKLMAEGIVAMAASAAR
jgi:uncharacterized lipoprotein